MTAAAVGLGVVAIAAGSTTGARAAGPSYTLNVVGSFGGEPSINSDSNGVLYDSSPSGSPPLLYRSTNAGSTWTQMTPGDTTSSDTCLATDQSNALYWCNLNLLTSGGSMTPTQGDVWKSTIPTTCTTSCNWQHGVGTLPSNTCGTSCSPFGVDRQWTAASIIPPATDTAHAEVVFMYHDIEGPSQIWVNISHDGGATFGAPQEVLAGPAITPGAVTGTLVAQGYTFCNTIPSGVSIVPNGKPHAGRIIVGWMAADLAQNATGCNVSMDQAFHTLWVSYSDDNGTTWTPQQAMDIGVGHDASTPFAGFNTDNQGNPYFAFASPVPGLNTSGATCGADTAAGTLQTDSACAYHMWVTWSNDQGATWNPGGGPSGLVAGSAGAAYEVDSGNQVQTDVFPTIAAGDPGKVDVSWLNTTSNYPTNNVGKFEPLGCDSGDNATNTTNPLYPPRCHWNVFAGQSLNLTATPASATWTTSQLTSVPMHYGDICNLGIACVQTTEPITNTVPRDPRNLLDFNQATIDQTTGCVHYSYADDNAGSQYGDPTNPSPYGQHLVSANQVDGPSVIGTSLCSLATVTPEAPLTALLSIAGAGIAVALGVRSRRRKLTVA